MGVNETYYPEKLYVGEWNSELVDENGSTVWPVIWIEGYVHVKERKPGDAKDNERYDAGDVVLIKQIIVGIRDVVPGDPDANQDGRVTVQDAILVQRKIVGLVTIGLDQHNSTHINISREKL